MHNPAYANYISGEPGRKGAVTLPEPPAGPDQRSWLLSRPIFRGSCLIITRLQINIPLVVAITRFPAASALFKGNPAQDLRGTGEFRRRTRSNCRVKGSPRGWGWQRDAGAGYDV
ncbi:hypothetical protein E2C01_000547 [Portunus trituberculatus]|uniref:Uncharacterized protein n=1 Tax=Portunus trituberculatus TaxID=210409 RepID=A0A5B7CFI1_PORTR|nr:hypothetical protein [Portunus trituberculatus]